MKRTELLEKCKSLGIKKVSSKSKAELIAILDSHKNTQNADTDKYKIIFNNVLKELLQYTSQKTTQYNNNQLKSKIKNYILLQNILNDTIIDKTISDISQLLGITKTFCKSLYQEIIQSEFIDRPIHIPTYIQYIKDNSQKCYDCNKQLYFVQKNTNRIWKNNHLCDLCWAKYKPQRDILWQQIITYKPKQCTLCSYKHIIQDTTDERFHYDHINMFNKDFTICDMVNIGSDIQIIYKELDKCQILCINCHHIITDIERKLGFTTAKANLNRKLTKSQITQDEYEQQKLYYQNLYQIKMLNVYDEVKKYIISQSPTPNFDTS